ncbi:Peptidase inhibitor family I36 [Granulicella pectinivorans]|jgi:hypothetical protein|uniref:Peptidase inhibitor family I36 n=1 Tax=Granulicella pectinivorans TaxID=474950 RepID=A0A1I6M371_9BACT|nr:peptidase inhibitor family I36 protein [Granulicella pectinivorans]SFS10103.1 Peptidase inhibitor family I36 [Granulicella pectinivorans]
MKHFFLTVFAFALFASTVPSQAQYPQGPPPPRPWGYDHGQPGTYRPEWDRYPDPERGACFYTDKNFSGHRFCVRAGDRLPSLPAGFGNRISSIRVFGRGGVTVFDQQGFRGARAQFGTIGDLGYTGRGDRRGWNDRISAIAVR